MIIFYDLGSILNTTAPTYFTLEPDFTVISPLTSLCKISWMSAFVLAEKKYVL
jgi:hypothetical protein